MELVVAARASGFGTIVSVPAGVGTNTRSSFAPGVRLRQGVYELQVLAGSRCSPARSRGLSVKRHLAGNSPGVSAVRRVFAESTRRAEKQRAKGRQRRNYRLRVLRRRHRIARPTREARRARPIRRGRPARGSADHGERNDSAQRARTCTVRCGRASALLSGYAKRRAVTSRRRWKTRASAAAALSTADDLSHAPLA